MTSKKSASGISDNTAPNVEGKKSQNYASAELSWRFNSVREATSIIRDGIRGYLSDFGMLWVVHRSTKQPGDWQCSTYDLKKMVIMGDTQHHNIRELFVTTQTPISQDAIALSPNELEPLLQQFIFRN